MISPALAALAAPVANAVASVSAGALRAADGAFEKLLRLGDETPAPAEAPTSAADVQSQADSLRSRLQQQILARLAEAGTPLKSPVVLESDPLDGVRVAGDHPQAAAIERILADDPNLASLFEQWSDVQPELSRLRRADEMERLFALDPEAAGRSYAETSLLDETEFRMTISPQ